MICDEPGQFAAHVFILRSAGEEAAVRHSLEHVEFGGNPGRAQLAMHAHRVGQEQVARARLQQRGRKARQIAEQGRDQRMIGWPVPAIKVSRGGRTKAVTVRAMVSPVTMPGVNGSGKESSAETEQKAMQSAIIVRSRADIFCLVFVIVITFSIKKRLL